MRLQCLLVILSLFHLAGCSNQERYEIVTCHHTKAASGTEVWRCLLLDRHTGTVYGTNMGIADLAPGYKEEWIEFISFPQPSK